APFLDIAGHIKGAEGADAGISAYLGRAFPGKVTELQDIGEDAHVGGAKPVIDRGETLADEFGVGGGFVPTNAAHGEVVLTRGKSAEFPRGRSRTISFVAEQAHGVAKLQSVAI